MKEKNGVIRTGCPHYACRVCRTKTGWRHQSWCALSGVTEPRCADCRYHDADRGGCVHPARRKGGAGRHERADCPL